MDIFEQIKESNMIEGIFREPLEREILAHKAFLALPCVDIADLEQFLSAYQSDALLRAGPGMNVTVGSHYPPLGGMHVFYQLQELLEQINLGQLSPWEAHVRYETLHPFTDGNGRSGRMLWYWQMRDEPRLTSLGFLHAFYYQTLKESRR